MYLLLGPDINQISLSVFKIKTILKNKNKNILVVAPHPDDETLGCGGSILKHIDEGFKVYWLIVTKLEKNNKYYNQRAKEIERVFSKYKFKNKFQLNFITSKLDKYSQNEIINEIKKIINKIKPFMLYLPFFNDAHSDHRIITNSFTHFAKSFRYPYIKDIRLFETLSETENSIMLERKGFVPNLWIDVTKYINKKCKIFKIYKSEIGHHPFPRSIDSILSLAKLRGITINKNYAESFILLKKVID